MLEDPIYRERKRQKNKEAYQRQQADPEKKHATRERKRLDRIKLREIPEKKLALAKDSARIRGIEWAITDEYALSLFNTPCHYCHRIGSGYDPHNGIDRKDSKIGYITSNALPCCGFCNHAKSTKSYEEMLEYIETVVNNRRDLLRNPMHDIK